jgi:hypothetical protein
MRSKDHYLSTTKRGDSTILYLSKPLLRFGWGGLLILATFGNLVADELGSPVGTPNAAPLPTDSPAPDNSAAPDNGWQAPINPQASVTPLLPQQQAGNANLPLSSSAWNTQSSQLTAPNLYTTGANNLSQVSTNSALTQAFSDQAVSGFLSEPGIGYSHAPIERVRLGPFDLKAALSINLVSDDNLSASGGSGGKIRDTSLGVTPAVLLEYGAEEGQKAYASLVYAPTLTRFFHHSDENTNNQNVALTVQYPFQRLTLDLSQTYAQVTGINVDLNSRTTQTSSVTTFGGNYDIDDKLTFSSHLQELITRFSGGEGQGGQTSSINSSLSYQISEKMRLGPSINVGLDKPQGAMKDKFEQGLLGFNYQPTGKFSLFAQGGAEFLQYDQGGDAVDPIFSTGIGYAPFDSTTFAVNASRSTRSSNADSAQTVVSTGAGFSATQRFLQRFYLNFSFNYSHYDNQSDTGGVSPTAGGSQDNLVYRPSLSFNPTAWTSIAIYYQYLDNESSTPGEGYHDNQMGISTTAQF